MVVKVARELARADGSGSRPEADLGEPHQLMEYPHLVETPVSVFQEGDRPRDGETSRAARE